MLSLSQTQKQTLKISPAQIQLLNLLQLSTLELEQHIKNEMEENPLLEEGKETETEVKDNDDDFENETDDTWTDTEAIDSAPEFADWDEFRDDDIPDYKTRVNNYSEDDSPMSSLATQVSTWQETVKEQLHWMELTEREQMLAEFVIDSLDEHGFLTYSADSLSDDVSFVNNVYVEAAEMEHAIAIIRQLDPPGLTARDLRECLLMQLEAKRENGEDVTTAYRIVESYLDEMGQRQYDKIAAKLSITTDELRSAIEQITTLHPRPVMGGQTGGMVVKENIMPDYLVTYDDGAFEVSLTSDRVPPLKINKSLAEMASNSKDAGATRFMKNKWNAANWLVEALQQRESTMMKAMRAIVELQRDYFSTGDVRQLKPMILKDIADRIGMDVSTISRVTSGKYAQTPFGLIHLKDLFTERIIRNDGTEISNRALQQAVMEMIQNEDQNSPLNDFQLTDMLAKRGFSVARRTVAKYREQMDIPAAPLRKVL